VNGTLLEPLTPHDETVETVEMPHDDQDDEVDDEVEVVTDEL
jgi:hypothetical protein